jgi:hypothetical protein
MVMVLPDRLTVMVKSVKVANSPVRNREVVMVFSAVVPSQLDAAPHLNTVVLAVLSRISYLVAAEAIEAAVDRDTVAVLPTATFLTRARMTTESVEGRSNGTTSEAAADAVCAQHAIVLDLGVMVYVRRWLLLCTSSSEPTRATTRALGAFSGMVAA